MNRGWWSRQHTYLTKKDALRLQRLAMMVRNLESKWNGREAD